MLNIKSLAICLASTAFAFNALAEHQGTVSDQFMEQQRLTLKNNTAGKGFGPQSPRDIDSAKGSNPVSFHLAPPASKMNLCNIHFHKNAEHKGGEFTKYAGNGNGHGYISGYEYSGALTPEELAPTSMPACAGEHARLNAGDTIEVHYVYSTAEVGPGETLNACFSEAVKNPQLRVETQVYVVVNDKNALDFKKLNEVSYQNHLSQALNLPENASSIEYLGSTTGPVYNEQGSPFQVTWRVRPNVLKVNIETVDDWCKANEFNEHQPHGVRTLVTEPTLLSPM